jgi:hypothetical protein
MSFYNTSIDRVYIINGLARSGNHLFISWLISSFGENTVYYLNNVKPTYHNLFNKNINLKAINNKHVITSNNKYGKKLDITIIQKLVKNKQMFNFLNGKQGHIKILIISMENKKTEKIDMLANMFNNYKHLYKCVVIRDILNLVSSRLQSEKILKNMYYTSDLIMQEYWLDNYKKINNKKYVFFNYNKFLCSIKSRKSLANKLNIKYDNTLITLNKFGLTRGSSFKNTITNKSDYFTRWVNVTTTNKWFESLKTAKNIHKILCKDFSMCIASNKTMIICDDINIKLE